MRIFFLDLFVSVFFLKINLNEVFSRNGETITTFMFTTKQNQTLAIIEEIKR